MKSISDTRIVARLHRNGGKVLCGKRDAEGRYVCNEMLLVVVNFPDDLSRVKPGTEILYKEPRACYGLWATTLTRRCNIRLRKARKCKPATTSGKRS